MRRGPSLRQIHNVRNSVRRIERLRALIWEPGAVDMGRHLFGVTWLPEHATVEELVELDAEMDRAALEFGPFADNATHEVH